MIRVGRTFATSNTMASLGLCDAVDGCRTSWPRTVVFLATTSSRPRPAGVATNPPLAVPRCEDRAATATTRRPAAVIEGWLGFICPRSNGCLEATVVHRRAVPGEDARYARRYSAMLTGSSPRDVVVDARRRSITIRHRSMSMLIKRPRHVPIRASYAAARAAWLAIVTSRLTGAALVVFGHTTTRTLPNGSRPTPRGSRGSLGRAGLIGSTPARQGRLLTLSNCLRAWSRSRASTGCARTV